MEAFGSSCISGNSKHNSAMAFFKDTSSFFFYATIVANLRYLLCTWSHSYRSSTFSSFNSCSLSLNSSSICVWRVLKVFEGSTMRSSCTAPSCSLSCSPGRHSLIGSIEMMRCRCPCGSITALYTSVGITTCGTWLTRLFSSMSCASIIFFIASCVVVNVVIGSVILS